MFDETICRTCLTVQDNLISITNHVNDECRVLDCFNNSMRITMKESDELPQMICSTCFDQILEVNKFYQKCIESENYFKKEISDIIKNKTENDKEEHINDQITFMEIDIVSPTDSEVSEKENESFECSICDASFKYEKNLKYHMNLAHDLKLSKLYTSKEYNCKFCQLSFKFEANFNKHMDRHKESRMKSINNPIKCSYEGCEESFIGRNAVEQHFQNCHVHILCQICGKKVRKKMIDLHLLRHKRAGDRKNEEYKCRYCDKIYKTKFNRKSHELSHTKERPYVCKYCGKTFKQSSVRNTHMYLHTGKPIQCTLCDKKFSRKGFLEVHMRSHTQERRYKCEICSQQYLQNCHLKNHMLISHSSEKPFQCDICDKVFPTKDYLQTHYYNHKKPYKCPACGLQAATSTWFKTHLQKAHGIVGDIKPYRRDMEITISKKN